MKTIEWRAASTVYQKYKKEYADYWKTIIGTDGDFDLKEEKEDN